MADPETTHYPADQQAYPQQLPPQQAYPEKTNNPPQYPGYPTQQPGYPPQQPGYPPKYPGYPTQQPGYPPQQLGYSPQSPAYQPYPPDYQGAPPAAPPPYTMQPPPVQQQQSSNVVVVQAQPEVVQTQVVRQHHYGSGDHGLVLAIIASFCVFFFGWWIGFACTIPAIFIALNAQEAEGRGDTATMQSLQKLSQDLSITGMESPSDTASTTLIKEDMRGDCYRKGGSNQRKTYLMDQSGASGQQNRILLSALPDSTGIMHYYYADELPRYIPLFKVLTVLWFVFATPLSLLCCLPIIFTLKKAERKVEDDIPSAQQAFCLCWVWLTLATLWIMLVLTSIVVGVALGIIVWFILNVTV